MHKVIIIGGGPAGLMAAISASKLNKKVILIEKNEKLGKKLYITGKGRCNLTNDVDAFEFLENVVSNKKFLYSAINFLPPEKTMSFFEESGLQLKTERGKRVFPLSNKASDVTKTLENACKKLGVEILLNTKVERIYTENGEVKGVVLTDKSTILGDSVIIATGGISYPLTGSTGDGYKFAKKLGHNITELKPALVGIELEGEFFKQLQGLSLKNVSLNCESNDKNVFSEVGEMLFTHFGVSGPLVLTLSSLINKVNKENLDIYLDLKPGLDYNTLENKFIREFAQNSLKTIANYLRSVLPSSLINEVLIRACIKQDRKLCDIKVEQRNNLINVLKRFEIKIKKLRSIEEAIVTSGGVNVKEINPKTMESKLIKGLYFAGEVIDVDAFTGGFNIQIAFSTGFLAGYNA